MLYEEHDSPVVLAIPACALADEPDVCRSLRMSWAVAQYFVCPTGCSQGYSGHVGKTSADTVQKNGELPRYLAGT